jgi:pimeloyl-ACP methyl ester carboxylesterase
MKIIDYLRRLFGGTSAPSTSPVPLMREQVLSCPGVGGSGAHDMAYVEWGDVFNPNVLICVHGLTRNSRDFDMLAEAMADRYRVVCPDVVGRGRSGWLDNKNDYGFPLYAADMQALIAHLGVSKVDWVGTSMGGLIGMLLAAAPSSPIGKLVLNDVGPVITVESLKRIGSYTGNAPLFPDYAAAEAYVRLVSAPFGPLTDAQWRHLTIHSLRERPDGQFEMGYDPGIAEAFRSNPIVANVDLWALYDMIKCPTLLIRGAESDLLARETAQQMTERGPKAQKFEIAGVGHAPMLMDDAQIGIVRNFLLAS